MTENEKKFLLNLCDKHELSLFAIISLLGLGATRSAMFANTNGNEALECAMIDLDIDCMSFLMEHEEANK